MSKGMSSRKDRYLLDGASGEWLWKGQGSWDWPGVVSSHLKLWLSLLLLPLTKIKLPRPGNKEVLFV